MGGFCEVVVVAAFKSSEAIFRKCPTPVIARRAATKQSTLPLRGLNGLLRCARNDGNGFGQGPPSPCGLRCTTLRPSGPCVAAPRVARRAKRGGARRDRTADLLHAMQALSQLSYGPLDSHFSVIFSENR